jgi:flavin reductase (DIM6/NTAB) family NADH-FMN oxidoreductase RutF
MSAQSIPTADFVAAMGQHVSSVCIITTAHDGGRFGLTATAVSSVCASPPRLLVCVNKSGLTHEKIAASGIFCVNVVNEDQEAIAKGFAGMLGKDFDRFASGQWDVLATGAPMLREAAAAFDCRTALALDQHSHTVFIGDVVSVRKRDTCDALLYGARRFRNLRKIISPPAGADMESLHF